MMAAAGVVPRGCGGDRCAFGRDAWPLHNVRHQGIFCRLCSSCVLLYHPAVFCSACLLLLPNPESSAAFAPVVAAPGPVSACSVCGLFVAHHSCVPDPVSFVCPTCAAAAHGKVFSYTGGRRAALDERRAGVLLVAARLSHESISRAAAEAREEAERHVRDAAVARRRADEMLEAACRAAEEEEAKESKKQPEPAATPAPPAPPATKKKKTPKSGEASRVDRDKLLKFNVLQQPALAFATAAAAAASSMPSPMEDTKPVVTEETQDSGDGSLSYERGPLLPWNNASV